MIGAGCDRMRKWIYRALIVIFGGTLIFSASQLVSYYANSRQQQQQFDELAQLVQSSTTVPVTHPVPEDPPQETEPTEPAETAPPVILPEYAELYGMNNHVAGWLQIEDTRINYPVMQVPDAVDYYLQRDFYGNYSAHGCLYAREQCDLNRPSDNITVYGHAMKDGSMFGGLSSYRSESYWKEHRYIRFDTLYEHHTYEIFAVFVTTAHKVKGFAYHLFVDAQDQADFDSFIAQCKELALYDTGLTPEYGDKLLTLSTCEYTQSDGRLVVMAKQIR